MTDLPPGAFAIDLPPSLGGARLSMNRQEKRDQVASRVARDGWEAFEAPLPAHFAAAVRRWPGLVVDVGANTGFYTLLALGAHPRNRVLAIEPVSDIEAALRRNLHENGFEHRVVRERRALGERAGRMPLYMPATKLDVIETSASLRADFKTEHRSVRTVEVSTLDRVLRRPPFWFSRVTVIKIDVEGMEAAVLAGAHRTVSRHRPAIFIEVLPMADFAALNGFLARHRYADIVLANDAQPARASEVAFHPQGWNHAFVPEERVDAFTA